MSRRNLPRKPCLDAFETLYVDYSWSVKRIAARWGLGAKEVAQELIDSGLEVDGRVKPGYMTQAQANLAFKPHMRAYRVVPVQQ